MACHQAAIPAWRDITQILIDAYPCDRLADTRQDARVDVEEIVTGHAGLARHASWDNDKIAACKSLIDSVGIFTAAGCESTDLGGCVCVREVDPNSCTPESDRLAQA